MKNNIDIAMADGKRKTPKKKGKITNLIFKRYFLLKKINQEIFYHITIFQFKKFFACEVINH